MALHAVKFRLLAFLSSSRGATAIEYGLIAAGIASAIAAATYAIGDEVVAMFEGLQGSLGGAG